MIHTDPFDAKSITRPDSALFNYYIVVSLLTLVGFPFVFLPLWIKYTTLQYSIDDEGVSMSWGFLYRREILLTYRRIQDIHVRRNLLHRWLGLAEVSIQTASGSSGAEMAIVGVRQPEQLRDYLYMRMRGVHGDATTRSSGADDQPPTDEALNLLMEIRDELCALRTLRERES